VKKLSLFVIVLALSLGVVANLRVAVQQLASMSADATAARATDGAFRDGIFLGGLAARRGNEPHIAVGRWATDRDRMSFAAGYRQGYSEFLATRATTVNNPGQFD